MVRVYHSLICELHGWTLQYTVLKEERIENMQRGSESSIRIQLEKDRDTYSLGSSRGWYTVNRAPTKS